MIMKNLSATVSVDSTQAVSDANALIGVLNTLNAKLSLDPFTGSGVEHLIPSSEGSVLGDELVSDFGVKVFNLLESACIEHLLQSFKIIVRLNETFGN